MDILLQLMDSKVEALLRVLFNSSEELYLREAAKKANVSVTSTLRVLSGLSAIGVVSVRAVKRMKLYSISKNEKSDALAPLFKKDIRMVEQFVMLVKDLAGLKAIYQHGEEAKNRVNLLLIGDALDEGVLKGAVAEIKEKNNFTISYIAVTLEQYNHMSQMGLWKGEKKVWERW